MIAALETVRERAGMAGKPGMVQACDFSAPPPDCILSAPVTSGVGLSNISRADFWRITEVQPGGIVVSGAFLDQLEIGRVTRVLALGRVLGDVARPVSDRFGARIVGVDLTPASAGFAKVSSIMAGYGDTTVLFDLNAPVPPIEDASSSLELMHHADMSVVETRALLGGVRRVSAPGDTLTLLEATCRVADDFNLIVPIGESSGASRRTSLQDYRAPRSLGGSGEASVRAPWLRGPYVDNQTCAALCTAPVDGQHGGTDDSEPCGWYKGRTGRARRDDLSRRHADRGREMTRIRRKGREDDRRFPRPQAPRQFATPLSFGRHSDVGGLHG